MLSKTVFESPVSHLVFHYRNSRIRGWRAYIGMAMLGFISSPSFIATSVPLEAFKFMLTMVFCLYFPSPSIILLT
ncbi:MAG: hypothetical protein ACUVUS_08950 [Thermoproteota archaeon]